jgi:hypothetical protein
MSRFALIHFWLTAFVGVASSCVCAFETPTHYAISLSAARLSLDGQTMRRLGRIPTNFDELIPASGERDSERDFALVAPICAHRSLYTADQMIACGAMFEDHYWYTRPLNHFLDPQHVDPRGDGLPLLTSVSAAEWALQDHPTDWPADESGDPQHYSYKDAERYFWNALTSQQLKDASGDSDVRRQNWGLLYQSLGQIIHLLQDMASPQHTRNEMHHDKIEFQSISQRSRYESRALATSVRSWIQACLVVPSATGCNYNPPFPISAVYPQFAASFQTPRSFWESASMTGLAQVTSRSFPSNLRNFIEDSKGHFAPAAGYPYPSPSGSKDVSLTELTDGSPDGLPTFIATVCAGGCKIKMVGAKIADPLSATAFYNDRASSESIFDQDLENFNQQVVVQDPLTGANYDTRTFSTLTVNRFNIDRAYSLLIPRAVSYSAGLLNFFFRGEMSITPPASGVYSVVDASNFSPANPTDISNGYRGFKSIRLTLANTTPSPAGAAAQRMTNGKLWAILKFQRNNCYTDDLDGLGTQLKPLSDCLNGVEEIVVSDPIDRAGIGRVVVPQPSIEKPDGEELEFRFPRELPINAWNVLLQVVFRGTLGPEENKIAVSTIDISEPTFFTIFNNTDYVYLGGSCYTPQQVKADSSLWKRVSSACYYPAHPEDILNDACVNAKYGLHLQNTGPGSPLLVIANESTAESDARIPPKHFSRFAVLADSEHEVDLSFHLWNPTLSFPDSEKLVHVTPFHAHKSRVTPGTSTRDALSSYRGVNAWNGLGFMMDVENMSVAEDDGTSCVGGGNDTLAPLVGAARYPVPSKITFAGP